MRKNGEGERHIASCSFGKDSLAMVLLLLETGAPLDEVVFYDTGMEFQAIYSIRDKLMPILTQHGVKYTELKPPRPFLYDMLERPKTKRTGEMVCGDGWCGGACRWGTFIKKKAIDKYCGNNHVYLGLAADEAKRIENLEASKSSPIAETGMTEADCLQYCRDKGYRWEEFGVDLYDVLDRVSCWCCANKNQWELYNIWKHLPRYWDKLKELQKRNDRPFKSGKYGYTIFEIEKRFESGYIPKRRQRKGGNL